MGDFVEIIFSYPTVVFTVVLGASLVLWGVTSVFGGDLGDDLDTDFDTDTDLDGSGEGAFQNALRAFGLGGLPPLLVLTLVSLFGWLVCVVVMTLVGDRSSAVIGVVGTITLLVALVVGAAVAGQLGRPLRPLFTPEPALRRRDLLGELCTITTLRVDADFGQAEVWRADGTSLLVQVRCDKENSLSAGARALIFSLDEDSGTYQVTPETEGLA
ncbi:MAG: DUF1449 family protein [Acidimicrobiales bacterium]|nr:DUF1449 family protein [Acidimicrobiales bacterium]